MNLQTALLVQAVLGHRHDNTWKGVSVCIIISCRNEPMLLNGFAVVGIVGIFFF